VPNGVPSQGANWNLSTWLDRLGLKRADQPPILDGVMPVQVLGDASALTSPLLPPLGWAGTVVPGFAAQRSGLAIRSRAPGGTFVRSLRCSANAALGGRWVWELSDTEHVFSIPHAVTPLTIDQMGAGICNTLIRAGTTILGVATNDSPTTLVGADMSLWVDEFYLAPGRELYIEHGTLAVTAEFAVLVQDCPAIIPTN